MSTHVPTTPFGHMCPFTLFASDLAKVIKRMKELSPVYLP